jgi:hypothetical protein
MIDSETLGTLGNQREAQDLTVKKFFMSDLLVHEIGGVAAIMEGWYRTPLHACLLPQHSRKDLKRQLLRRRTPMSMYELAQLNIGIIKGPMDSPLMADFTANLDRINALAERSEGFVWRLQTEEGNATALRPFDNPDLLLNMSVWKDIDSLHRYVYNSGHVDLMRRRREWFERMAEAFLVLWWVPKDHRPSITEAISKLETLRKNGPTAEAFTFRNTFPAPHQTQTIRPIPDGGECPAT